MNAPAWTARHRPFRGRGKVAAKIIGEATGTSRRSDRCIKLPTTLALPKTYAKVLLFLAFYFYGYCHVYFRMNVQHNFMLTRVTQRTFR